ncbi:MAG: Asp-tRNA(Asn)/Glu-tRNA(Gln) amidotransferase subunit GatC [Gammaproteobacteria bacterium]|nr:Asp-tRNA(Asn)/Glu-tRNA(Gln) amidotransferase subunit GatC [Gammaproteobacteria bacterium]MYI77029.1 Asp-tRNA(Asn)/Glu-tRNA(Gln) amidotransferase subunit GatC [Gammaproteobacteria bacterium]
MNSKILNELCAHCAFTLNDAEKERLVADLKLILEYIDQVQTVPTDGIDPLVHPISNGHLRKVDEPETSGHENLNQTESVETAEGFYVVPKVIEP